MIRPKKLQVENNIPVDKKIEIDLKKNKTQDKLI